MILVVALDDHGGMMFNRRRQSKDRALRLDLLQTIGSNRLWMNDYSAKQFELPLDPRITISADYLAEAGPGDYCFVEEEFPSHFLSKVEGLVIYRWNRIYPKDVIFQIPLAPWALVDTREFTGYSHDKITKEVYTK